MMEAYKTIQGTAQARIEEKKSEFIAHAAFADTEEKTLAFLNGIRAKHRTANHNVYAYILRDGARMRYSDDGEPAKTSGLPTLEAIRHAGLVDCIVVTTRYFGGTLLGTGGLVRAYTAAANAVLAAAKQVTVQVCVRGVLRVEYPLYELAQRLLAAANGDAALLYLYLFENRPLSGAQTALRMTQARYDLACATLQQLGLWPQEARTHLDASQAPVYTEQDVIRETRTSREFEAITGETQRRLGRVLSNEELKILLSIYRYLGLPGEVISILVNYCIQRQRSRGISRMPSLRSIEKEAYYWADHGIDTMEQAAVYMQNQLLRQSQLGKIRELFGITGRRLTTGEENYILTWLSWGFGEQEIGLAYEKTCMATGGLKWPYCNSILRSWHEQGFTTLSQIEAGDRAPQRSYAGAKLSQGVQQHNDTLSDFQLAAIDRMLNNKED